MSAHEYIMLLVIGVQTPPAKVVNIYAQRKMSTRCRMGILMMRVKNRDLIRQL